MLLNPGSHLGPYEILGPLGAGGMGEVYRARDPRLERDVAVKVLPTDVASRPDRLRRFEREARSVAALNHPNIVTLHSIEEFNGIHFLTMELIQGESLDRVVTEGGLPFVRILDLTIPLADALAAAHARGVVHRDLKPANVMVTREGRVKVLDFGLATAANSETPGTTTISEAATSSTAARPLSIPGLVMGTAPYMAPEQLRGAVVEAPADLFALGILLYELTTGRRPFQGATFAELSSAILRDSPEPLERARPGTPPGLAQVIERCLEKDPLRRVQSAEEVRNALERLRRSGASTAGGTSGAAGAPTPATTPSIAVLPFANMSPDPADEFFSDGITEEIINTLAQLPRLRVAARGSCFAFKGRHEDLRAVGEKLGVTTILEGSVRKAGSRLRITAQLINAADGYHIWSERYDREFADIFAIQDEIAATIAEKLQLALEGAERPGAGPRRDSTHERRTPAQLEAYELYLKGRVLQTRRGSALLESAACFERAIALDPDLIEAHVWLADAYRLLAIYGIRRTDEMIPRARAAAERAIALDPKQVEGMATLAGIVSIWDHDLPRAKALWDRALAIDPTHVRALCERALDSSLFRTSNASETARALRDCERAIELDSLNAWAAGMRAFVLGIVGQADDAVSQARTAVDLDANNFLARWALVQTLVMAGRHEEALVASEPALAMSGRHPVILAAVAAAQAARGRIELAHAILQELEGRSRTGYVPKAPLAAVAASAGRFDEARRLAGEALEENEGMLYFWRGFAEWTAFRSDAGCSEILSAAGL